MKNKGRGPWLNLLDKSEVLTLLLEIYSLPTVFILITSSPPSEGTSPRLSFPQAVPRVGADNFALYNRGSGERDTDSGGCQEKRTSEVAVDVVDLSSRIPYGHEFSGGRRRIWLGLALSYFLLCRASELFACANGLVLPDFCLTRDCLTLFRGDVQGNIEDRAHADSVEVLLMASKNRPESRRLYDHPRAHGGRGGGWQDTGRSFRSTGGAPRRIPATSRRRPPDDETYGVWGKVITRTEASLR